LSEPKLISPLLDNFAMGEAISNHHGVRCYPAMKNDSDSRYIVKVISIPASQVQLQALLLTGAFQNEDSAKDYFYSLAKGVAAEKDTLDTLAKLEGFLPFDGCQIVPMENEVGYDVYLLSPYRRTLARAFRKDTLTHLAAVNLGLDICASLAVARQSGYLYSDLKPENIYICNDKEYRLGDLGFLRLDSLKYASLPDRFISPYTAPEVVDAYSDINPTLDIYAAGLVLYQVYNGNELPFEGRAPSDPLPPPVYADYEMAEIIMKACAPDPKDRWQDPIAMGQALVAYMQRNSVNDTPIVTAAEDHSSEVPILNAEAPVSEEKQPPVQELETAEAPEVREAPDDEDDQLQLDAFYDLLNDAEAEKETAEPEILSEQIERNEVFEQEAEEPDALDAREETQTDAEESDEDELLNLSFLDDMVSDDTAPSEEMAIDFNYEAIGDDASDILAQADDLLQHEAPAGVVAPEPIDIDTIVPPPIQQENVQTIELDLQDVPDAEKTQIVASNVALKSEDDEAELDDEDEDEDEDDDDFEEESSENEADDQSSKRNYDLVARRSDHRRQIAKKKARRSKVIRRWIVALLILLLLGGLAFGGYLFYKDYYLCSVISLVPSGNEDKLVVSVDADIDESLLTVYCIDTHGNSLSSPVVNGQATFNGLTPNTLYSVKVEVSGLHKLTGEIAESYTTPVLTNIVSFSAVTGNEPGTAILNFTVDGMDSDTWVVTYSAEGVEEQRQVFSGHMVTISNLIAGKTYTFRLGSGTDLYITGTDTLEYTASDPVFAQNLAEPVGIAIA